MPAYKAGGPIQSCANLVRHMFPFLEIYILSSNKEYGKGEPPLNVPCNHWVDFEATTAKVYYSSHGHILPFKIKGIIQDINPDFILVNGLFSLSYSILPALLFSQKTILHFRGMLHPGALQTKARKKKLFIALFKFIGLNHKIFFCASDAQERGFAQSVLGDAIKIHIAQNFPAKLPALAPLKKQEGVLKMLSIALISPMKNHLLVLQALQLLKTNLVYDIYGPIKDQDYWEKCLLQIQSLPSNIKVNYKSELPPNMLSDTLAQCHVYSLPSASENFGHALFEAMVSGKPILTSNYTPWNNLEINKAGINADLTPVSIAAAIEVFAAMSQDEYNTYVSGVRTYAENAIDREAIKQQYLKMFGA